MVDNVQNEAKENKRFYAIDFLESIAIFFVVLYHSTLFDSNFLNNSSFLLYFRYFLRSFLSTCVPLFFLANGFLLFNKSFNLKKHLLKMFRLIIQFVFWTIITTFFLFIAKGEIFEFNKFAKIILTLKSGWLNHFWFMLALFCIYILFPLLKVVYDNNKKIFIYFVIVSLIFTFGVKFIFTVISCSIFLFFSKSISFDISFYFLGPYGYSFVYFCLGGLLFLIINKIKAVNIVKRNILITVLIIFSTIFLFSMGVLFSFSNKQVYDVVWNGYDTIFTLLNTISIFILCLSCREEKNKANEFFKFISTNTFGIYFVHWILICFTRKYIKQCLFLCTYWFNIIYAIILTILCAFISYCIKRIPIIKKLL